MIGNTIFLYFRYLDIQENVVVCQCRLYLYWPGLYVAGYVQNVSEYHTANLIIAVFTLAQSTPSNLAAM